MFHLHGPETGRKPATWRSRAIRAAIAATVPCLIFAGRSAADPGRPWWATGDQDPITYDYGGTTLYFGFYWDGSQYSSTDKMHMYRDLSGDQSSLQE